MPFSTSDKRQADLFYKQQWKPLTMLVGNETYLYRRIFQIWLQLNIFIRNKWTHIQQFSKKINYSIVRCCYYLCFWVSCQYFGTTLNWSIIISIFLDFFCKMLTSIGRRMHWLTCIPDKMYQRINKKHFKSLSPSSEAKATHKNN